jgi:hypothetical protein
MTDDGKVTLHFVHDFLEARLLLLRHIKVSFSIRKDLMSTLFGIVLMFKQGTERFRRRYSRTCRCMFKTGNCISRFALLDGYLRLPTNHQMHISVLRRRPHCG